MTIVLAVPLALVELVSTRSHAAEISEISSPECRVLLTGEIAKGDQDRLRAAFEAAGFSEALYGESGGGDAKAALCLDSDGGCYSEALNIAELIYSAGVTTGVDAGMECYSACALIFMAGRVFGAEEDYPSRRLHVSAVLGFHAPYLVIPQGQYNKEVVEYAYRQATLSISRFLSLANKRGSFSVAPHIQASLIENMLLRSSDDMLIVDRIDQVGRWGITLFGYLPPTLTKQSAFNACNNLLAWKADSSASESELYMYGRDYIDNITVRPYVGEYSNVLVGSVAHVDNSGLVSEWCDIVKYDSEFDEDQFVSICAISDTNQYGSNCEDEMVAFGELVEAYALFDPTTVLMALPKQ